MLCQIFTLFTTCEQISYSCISLLLTHYLLGYARQTGVPLMHHPAHYLGITTPINICVSVMFESEMFNNKLLKLIYAI